MAGKRRIGGVESLHGMRGHIFSLWEVEMSKVKLFTILALGFSGCSHKEEERCSIGGISKIPFCQYEEYALKFCLDNGCGSSTDLFGQTFALCPLDKFNPKEIEACSLAFKCYYARRQALHIIPQGSNPTCECCNVSCDKIWCDK